MADSFNSIAALTDSIPIIILQKSKEFLKLLSILQRHLPESLLEIRTLGGRTLYFFSL